MAQAIVSVSAHSQVLMAARSQVLIYVFDIESQQLEKDIQYFTLCIEALKSNSDNAKVFCLVRPTLHSQGGYASMVSGYDLGFRVDSQLCRHLF